MNMEPVQFTVSSDELHKVIGIVSRIALLVQDLGDGRQIARVTYADEQRSSELEGLPYARRQAIQQNWHRKQSEKPRQYVIEAYIQTEKDAHTQIRHCGEDVAPTIVWHRVMDDLERMGTPFLIELSISGGQKRYVRWQRG